MYKKFIIFVLIIVLASLLMKLNRDNNKLKSQLKQKTKTIDSLRMDLYSYDMMLNEYTMMYEGIDSSCREKIDSLMIETE